MYELMICTFLLEFIIMVYLQLNYFKINSNFNIGLILSSLIFIRSKIKIILFLNKICVFLNVLSFSFKNIFNFLLCLFILNN